MLQNDLNQKKQKRKKTRDQWVNLPVDGTIAAFVPQKNNEFSMTNNWSSFKKNLLTFIIWQGCIWEEGSNSKWIANRLKQNRHWNLWTKRKKLKKKAASFFRYKQPSTARIGSAIFRFALRLSKKTENVLQKFNE